MRSVLHCYVLHHLTYFSNMPFLNAIGQVQTGANTTMRGKVESAGTPAQASTSHNFF